MKNIPQLPKIPKEEQTPVVKILLSSLEDCIGIIRQLKEQINHLKDENNILKGEKKRPNFKSSKLDKKTTLKLRSDKKPQQKVAKKKKNSQLTIHEEKRIPPETEIPKGSCFKGYSSVIVQDLIIKSHNISYLLERWVTLDNKELKGKLPKALKNRRFGSRLINYIIYQHHHCQTTQPLLLEQLLEWGVDISAGQINNILLDKQDIFHEEKNNILQTGLEVSFYVTVDDSGARHKGKNGYVTHIGNEFFGWFESSSSKSRVNFLSLLRAGYKDYHLTQNAIDYMRQHKLPEKQLIELYSYSGRSFATEFSWQLFLNYLEITKKRDRKIITEGALLGSVLAHGFCKYLTIVSDGAGQFNVLSHALCWVHTERLIHKILALNDKNREEIAKIRDQLWELYSDLKAYKLSPKKYLKNIISDQFDAIFSQKTSNDILNKTLYRIHKNKRKLLLVLEKPQIPLHTNGSETDIRDYVKKRKVSGGTRSDDGLKCRDTFASLKKTCRKLGISFWLYLNDRNSSEKNSIPPLSDIIRNRTFALSY